MLMERGVDAEKFSPDKRTVNDGVFRFGFVGRLRPEKNVRLLIDLEKKLIAAGKTGFEFLIVGEGNEREELMKKMKHAKFTGFIDGAELAEAYANMDVFVFPSETDAYGNVIQEAAASGVPSIVTDKGGPKYLVADGETGFIATDPDQFFDFALLLMDDPERMEAMRKKARERALSISWDAVFAGVFDAYRETLRIAIERKRASSNGFKN